MEGGLPETELAKLRNRFKRDAELLLHPVSDEEEKSKEKAVSEPLPRFNRHSIFWILASIGLTYYVDFFQVILENENIKRNPTPQITPKKPYPQ